MRTLGDLHKAVGAFLPKGSVYRCEVRSTRNSLGITSVEWSVYTADPQMSGRTMHYGNSPGEAFAALLAAAEHEPADLDAARETGEVSP